jgi:myo-inositol catabolism protein IolH
VKTALDPTPFHDSHSLLEFPKLLTDLGYKYTQMTPHADFIPFFNHPTAEDEAAGDTLRLVHADTMDHLRVSL